MRAIKLILILIGILTITACGKMSSTNNCTNCNEHNSNETNFCSNCGKEIVLDEQTSTPTPAIPTETPKQLSKEEQVLGKSNAFVELYGDLPVHKENYRAYLEDMMLILAESIQTHQLGTYKAQTVIKGLVPYEVYKNQNTASKKMDSIYDYFTKGQISHYFTLIFNDGKVVRCELREEGLKAFVSDGVACGVFNGQWGSFNVSYNMTIESFCQKMNVTKEVAVSLLAICDTYDINWLVGNNFELIDKFD
ncbi:MAG: zinc ribbon domain-containing protein [Clostridia bacterium]|nr:zinc ribbon domain-containing protein [Clostridia bacterium]